MSMLWMAPASAQPVPTTVSAADQSARDDERLRVLRDELRKAEASVDSLARRKAERLAVADMTAADEAEEQRIRALSDIAGIKREIAAARPSADASKAVPTAPPPVVNATRPTPSKGQPSAPWWDVYAKSRRGDSSASNTSPVPLIQPPGTTAAQTDPTRRME